MIKSELWLCWVIIIPNRLNIKHLNAIIIKIITIVLLLIKLIQTIKLATIILSQKLWIILVRNNVCRVSSDAASSRKSSTDPVQKISSAQFCESIVIVANIVDWRSALPLEWVVMVSTQIYYYYFSINIRGFTIYKIYRSSRSRGEWPVWCRARAKYSKARTTRQSVARRYTARESQRKSIVKVNDPGDNTGSFVVIPSSNRAIILLYFFESFSRMSSASFLTSHLLIIFLISSFIYRKYNIFLFFLITQQYNNK